MSYSAVAASGCFCRAWFSTPSVSFVFFLLTLVKEVLGGAHLLLVSWCYFFVMSLFCFIACLGCLVASPPEVHEIDVFLFILSGSSFVLIFVFFLSLSMCLDCCRVLCLSCPVGWHGSASSTLVLLQYNACAAALLVAYVCRYIIPGIINHRGCISINRMKNLIADRGHCCVCSSHETVLATRRHPPFGTTRMFQS